MIGDWVKSRGKIEQVREVYDGYICTDSFEDSHDYYFDPIPLTPEILEKNGFARDEIAGWRFRQYEDGLGLIYEIYWNNKGDELEIVSNLSNIGSFDKKGIQFVHQLQHARRLCGIKKEIMI